MNDFLVWIYECLRINCLIIVTLVELLINRRRSQIAITIMYRVVEAVIILALLNIVFNLMHSDLICVLLVHDRRVWLLGLDCALKLLCTALVFALYFRDVRCIGYSPSIRLIYVVICGLFVAHGSLRDRLIKVITSLVHVQLGKIFLGRGHLRVADTRIRGVDDHLFAGGLTLLCW